MGETHQCNTHELIGIGISQHCVKMVGSEGLGGPNLKTALQAVTRYQNKFKALVQPLVVLHKFRKSGNFVSQMKKKLSQIAEKSLFSWFSETISEIFGKDLSGTPGEVLTKLKVPPGLYPWLDDLHDHVYPMIQKGGVEVPDLESRSRNAKRKSGQYYTPETLVKRLFAETRFLEDFEDILDPACGDGAFLIPALETIKAGRIGQILGKIRGFDIDPHALVICLARLLQQAPDAGWPLLEVRDFLLDPPVEKFNLIVGNPPYRVNLAPQIRESLKLKYETSEGEKDLYTFFIEGSIKALKPDGKALLLTSHTFLVNHQCSLIRRFLFKKHSVKFLFFLPNGFFPYAPGVIPVVTGVENCTNSAKMIKIFDKSDSMGNWSVEREVGSEQFLEPTGVRQALRDHRLDEIFRKMDEASRPLGELARIGVGIQESNIRGTAISRFVSDRCEDSNFEKVLRGREVDLFKINWDGKYLNYGPHLVYPGNPEIFRGRKILYQNIRNESLSRRIVATIDKDGYFPKNSLSVISTPIAPFSLEYILGIITSPLINCWFRENFFSFHVTVTQVRQIPIPLADCDKRARVEILVKQIMQMADCRKNFSEVFEELSVEVVECFFPFSMVKKVLPFIK